VREGEIDKLEDLEASPSLPSATLAAGAAAAPPTVVRHDSYREIFALAWPVMLSQTLVSGVGLVDIAMVGRLGADAVAAVGYATQFFFLSQSLLFAVGFACVALMARAIGGGDTDRARHAFAASLCVAVFAALLVVALILAAPRAILHFLGAEAAVIDSALPYLRLVLGSSVLLAVSMTVECAMRADKNTRTPMRIALVVTSVKLGLNALLIFGALGLPRLELVGAGIATAVSQAVGISLSLLCVARARPGSAIALRPRDFAGARASLPTVVRIALPGIGERLAMNLALLAYFRVLADYGTVAIAAYTVGIRILSFSWIPGTGFGAAAATLVGQALGARDADAAMRAGWRATRVAVIVAVTLGAACALAREPLARLFTTDPATVAELSPFLLILALAQPFLQAHFTLGGAHRGAGDTWTPFVAAAVANWALRVPLAFALAWVLRADLVWIWSVLLLDHFARSAWLLRSFRRGAWRTTLGTSTG
jgi:putative MATE family efflux protein